MKILLVIIFITMGYFYINNFGKVHINAYTKSDGTHVKAHYRSSP